MTTKSTTTRKKQTTFEKLSSINVNKYVEKKAGLTYLSWAYAWAETKKHCPDARYEILETTYDDSIGFMCNTQVTIEGETLAMWLPVMDSKNQSMKKHKYSYTTRYGEKEVSAATTFDINKTMMRCLVKNLAMFGLGIYIYAGEDMPIEEEKVVSSKTPTASGKPNLEVGDAKWEAMANFCVANKSLGYKKLCDKIGTKYTLSAGVKNEIKNLIK
tara:strand:- start:1364 stop:2008 length:645 start_codon:yes stop_codon:yes gene_type:complete